MKTAERRLRVLFVDDDPALRTTLRYQFLGDHEIEATTVASAELALDLLAHPPDGVPFDVLVSDQRMPGMSGSELCFKAREVAPETARVIFSAYMDRDARMCPCSAVLEKPDRGGKLKSVIESAANGRQHAATDEQMREREREAEEELAHARADFRETTEKLRSWTPKRLLEDKTNV